MNKEQQLEQVASAITEYQESKAPPIFELFAAIVAMSISTLLFVLVGVFEQDATFYKLMRTVLPQTGWAVTYFVAGMMSTVALLIDSVVLRVVALTLMVAAFGITAAFYIVTFPNLSGILMFWITVFTAVSIPMVKYTGLRHKN